MNALLIIIHIIVCLILIFAVLLQSGKSADLAGAFGGVGSQTAFGPRGSATLLSKITTISAILFMFTSLGLWMMSAKGVTSAVKGEEPAKTAATAPQKNQTATPVTPQPAEKSSPAQEKPASSGTEKK